MIFVAEEEAIRRYCNDDKAKSAHQSRRRRQGFVSLKHMFDKSFFDNSVERRGTGCVKWDLFGADVPMWVADMDFPAAPEIVSALEERVSHRIFGYSIVTDEWREAVCEWCERRHGIKFETDHLLFATGVVPILTNAVRALTEAYDSVVVLTPVYNHFFTSVTNCGRRLIECPLLYDGTNYDIDFSLLESMLSLPETKLILLCNPHNPIGRIWSRETLKRIADLCRKHGVTVVSDEIHCDITDPRQDYVPFASVSEWCYENSITCIAPTKSFNLAGLHSAAAIVPNPDLRQKLENSLEISEVNSANAFAIPATVAAFRHGAEWLDALREYLFENKRTVEGYIKENLPLLSLTPSNATYLLWLNAEKICPDTEKLTEHLLKNHGLLVTKGKQYRGNGEGFIRLNIACPRSQLVDALHRLAEGIKTYTE